MLIPSSKKIFISAGEKSGDLHAAELAAEAKKLEAGHELSLSGLGGDKMKAEGVELLYHVNELTTSGITGVLKKYKYFKRVLKNTTAYIRNHEPDAVVLIDFPGFNLKLAENIRKFYKKKIIYYISPQVWAWHSSRVQKIKAYVDEMLVVFPFEVEFYRQHGVSALYIGHPLTRRITEFLAENRARGDGEKKVITILPGSRTEEIKHHMQVLIEAARHLKKEFDAEIFFHAADSINAKTFDDYKRDLRQFTVTRGEAYKQIFKSDLVLTKAGTSTVECALIGTPFIVFYRTSPVNYHLIKPMVKVRKMGMVNILTGKDIVREFIQNQFTAENLVTESKRILSDATYREEMKKNLAGVWEILGNKDASANAARVIIQRIENN